MTDALLSIRNATKRYGKVVAVDDVTVDIYADEVTALIGPNGAGKTTLYNVISGKGAITEGQIVFDGEDITGYPPRQRTDAGLGRCFQVNNIFEEISVRKNIRIPVISKSDQKFNMFSRVADHEGLNAETDRILELVGLEDLADLTCSELSYGDKRRVEFGIAIATDPKMILLDEPTAGMSPAETDDMVEFIRELERKTDITFMITEHDMDVIFEIAERILVLHQGRLIADGRPEEIRAMEEVKQAYLGGDV